MRNIKCTKYDLVKRVSITYLSLLNDSISLSAARKGKERWV
jgi:hypothetical protein